jgi:hypothetical protein
MCFGLALTPAAFAGTYEVHSCAPDVGRAASSAGWSVAPETNIAAAYATLGCNDAGNNSGINVFASPYVPHARGSKVGLRWTAAESTRVVSFGFHYEVYAPGNLQSGWTWQYQAGLVNAATGLRVPVDTCRSPQNACGGSRFWETPDSWLPSNKASGVWLAVTCVLDLPQDCPAGYGAKVTLTAAKFVVEDTDLPLLDETPTGELISSSAIASGIADLRVAASDAGGGLMNATIEVDGAPVSTHSFDDGRGLCSPPYTQPAPCPRTARTVLSYDTSQLEDGPHTVRLLVSDATGSNTTTYGPIEVITSNGTPPSATRLQSIQCPALADPGLRVRLSRRTVTYGRSLSVNGRVTGGAANTLVAIAGALGGGVAKLVPTRSDGRFRAKIQPARNQQLRAIALAPGAGPRCSAQAAVKVRARTSLKASKQWLRNGRTLRLTGKLRGGHIPTRGKTIVIRVRAAGSREWYRAGTVRSDGSGRWRWNYRFLRTRRSTTYVFRAVVTRERHYPFQRGGSAAYRVTVVP